MSNMNIKEFLLARIDEDARTAQRMLDELGAQIEADGLAGVDENGPFTPTRLLSAQLWAFYDGQTRWRNFARGQYLARIADPKRILAECEAKRAIAESWEPWFVDGGITAEQYDLGEQTAVHHAVRALAAVYSDHPDYRDEWSIESVQG